MASVRVMPSAARLVREPLVPPPETVIVVVLVLRLVGVLVLLMVLLLLVAMLVAMLEVSAGIE